MRRAVFGPDALEDLDQIHDYIAADNPAAADRMIAKIEDRVRSLAAMPHVGHTRADVKRLGYRFWTVKPYVIVYRYTDAVLTVIRVLHGARDFRKALEG